jgi:hypothetical protein
MKNRELNWTVLGSSIVADTYAVMKRPVALDAVRDSAFVGCRTNGECFL